MTDITPAAHGRAIQWLQERLVFWALGFALLSGLIAASAATMSLTNTLWSRQQIAEQSRTMNEWMDDANELHQLYSVQMNQLRAGYCPAEVEQ